MEPARPSAVFLSYASQDVEKARRIADALRAFGVEVWFDEHELRGGDIWDQKIRKQIHDCALFLAVISTATQERAEGYFRREWKLAVERTQDLAEGVPFIVPIVVDDIPKNAAVMPEAFRQAQWTMMPHGVPSPEFVEQVKRLLEAPRKPAGPVRSAGQPVSTVPVRRAGLVVWGWSAIAVLVVLAGLAAWLAFRPPPSDGAKSIAVLPFENMSEDKANAIFCDGLHEEVITALWKVRNLRVISRTSVLEYRPGRRNLRTIAKELGATHLLEGSVRRAGEQLRVTVQLIDGRTDRHLWAETFDKTVKDQFAIQAQIAAEVARALTASLSPEDRKAISQPPTQNQAAYDLYLKARARDPTTGQLVTPKITDREADLAQVVELEPKFLTAWCELSRIRSLMHFNHVDVPSKRPARMEAARAALERAQALQPDAPEVILARGYYDYWVRRDYEKALVEFSSAARLSPNDAETEFALGQIQRRLGRFQQSAVFLEKAVERDPRNPEPLENLAWVYRYLRDGRSADAAYARALRVNPRNFKLGHQRAWSAFLLLNEDSAVERFLASVSPERDKNGQVSKARFEWMLWNRRYTEARQLFDALLARKDVEVGADWRVWNYGRLLWLTNQHEELRRLASRAIEALRVVPPEEKLPSRKDRLLRLASAEAALGNAEAAFGVIREIEDVMTSEGEMKDPLLRGTFDWVRINVYLVLERHDELFDLLGQLLARPSAMTVRALQTCSIYDPVRSLPRFQKLVRQQ